MKTSTYKRAQEAYDRMEHPDYWKDDQDDLPPVCNGCGSMDDFVNENRAGYCRNCYNESLIDSADFKRKEAKEDALLRSLNKEGDSHEI